jgi:universal stress protein A
MLPLKKILCPTDFSEPSHKGIEAAVEMAKTFQAELILITVITPVPPAGAPGMPTGFMAEEYYKEMQEHSGKALEEIKMEKSREAVKMKSVVALGNAADEILKRAESEKVDLIVTATHGWTGWRRLIFGSVAEKIVRLAKCPVLTIPGWENDAE